MGYFLFFIYLVLFCWLLTKIKFFKKSDLNSRAIIILFLIRVLAGIANGWISLYYYGATDSVEFNNVGIAEYHLLFSNPKEYLINIFYNTHKSNYAGFLDANDSFWNDLRSNLITKLLSIFNIFSRGNYFINILFYNFLIFFGAVSIYKIFSVIFPGKNRLLLTSVFLIPSTLYFTSGIHRDGLIFLGLGIVFYNTFYVLRREGLNSKRAFNILGGILIIFLLRNFIFITLIPALTAWIIAEKKKKNILQTFIFTYLFFGILFFTLKFLHPKLDLPQSVSDRQMLFIDISKSGGSTININRLYPNFRSFLNNTPQALNHSLMRPYLTEIKTLFYIPLSIEIAIYEILFLLFLLFPLKNNPADGFIYSGIAFSICMCMIVGYTIPVIGALVRYRSIYFPFLITPLLCMTDYKKLLYILLRKKLI